VVLQLNECVKEMVIAYLILISSLTASLCHFLLTVSEFGVLLLIPNILVKLIDNFEISHMVFNNNNNNDESLY